MEDRKLEAPLHGEYHPHEGWKMYVYSPARHTWSACIYYRVWVPMRALSELGLINGWCDRGDSHYEPEEAEKRALFAMLTSDIALFYSLSGEIGTNFLQKVKGMKPGTIAGKLIYPPSAVYDIDDNLDHVQAFNNTYAVYGVRDSTGRLLEPGEDVIVRQPNGEELVLWRDKVTKGNKGWVFDIERNLRTNRETHDFARSCDGFTCPSPFLAKYLRETHGYPEPYVYPNSIIPEDWPTARFAPRKDIRILWQGGGSHMSDWYYLRSAVQYIAKKYPNVKFVFFGTQYGWVSDVVPKEQLELHPWVPYDGYKPTRVLMDADINLCVLRDDVFSKSKSAIKWYEGSILAKPEATLAPNIPPYGGEIVDGETGLLYDATGTPSEIAESFAANLEHLIKNEELRRTLGENAKKWVLENRHYLKTGKGLYDYYYDLRVRKMRENPFDAAAEAVAAEKLKAEYEAEQKKAAKKRRAPRAKRKAGKK